MNQTTSVSIFSLYSPFLIFQDFDTETLPYKKVSLIAYSVMDRFIKNVKDVDQTWSGWEGYVYYTDQISVHYMIHGEATRDDISGIIRKDL
jgi:hypothetical protein